MTRVATFGNYQSALLNLMNTQIRSAEAQERVSTQKNATDLTGFGRKSETLTALKGSQSRIQGFIDTAEAVKEICPRGVDYAFECVGHPALIRHAIDLLDWGGQCILLGVPKLGTEASFVVNTLYNDKSIMGCRYGSTRPHHDIPMLVRFYLDGRLQLDEMVSQVYDLADITQALEDMHAGKLNRGVLAL